MTKATIVIYGLWAFGVIFSLLGDDTAGIALHAAGWIVFALKKDD